MKQMNATRKGPGRRPQRISDVRYAAKKQGITTPLAADFSGAKLIRRAMAKRITLNH